VPIVEAVAKDDQYDALVLGGMLFGKYGEYFGDAAALAEADVLADLGLLVSHTSKPLFMQSAFAARASDSVSQLRSVGIPYLEWADEVVWALNSRRRGRPPLKVLASTVAGSQGSTVDRSLSSLTENLVNRLESAHIGHGIGRLVPESQLPVDSEERWVLRLDGFTHKEVAGAIEVGLSGTRLREGWQRLATIAMAHNMPPRIRLAPFIEHDYEFIVTFWRDDHEGNGWLFGQGGTGVELTRDIAVGRIPATEADVDRVLNRTQLGLRLQSDLSALQSLTTIVLDLASLFVTELSNIEELECNPIAVRGDSAWVLDVLPILRNPSGELNQSNVDSVENDKG
jgi:hypothetical protein